MIVFSHVNNNLRYGTRRVVDCCLVIQIKDFGGDSVPPLFQQEDASPSPYNITRKAIYKEGS